MSTLEKGDRMHYLLVYAAGQCNRADDEQLRGILGLTEIAGNLILRGDESPSEALFLKAGLVAMDRVKKSKARTKKTQGGEPTKPPRKGSRRYRYLEEARRLGHEAAHDFCGKHEGDRDENHWIYHDINPRWDEWYTLNFNDQGDDIPATQSEVDEAYDAIWKAYDEERSRINREEIHRRGARYHL